jgi:multisubunit Na+/H+ antiporter MnhG subunit
MNDTSGCALVLVAAFALFVGIVILAAIAEVAAELTGCNSSTVLGWELGILGTVLFVWMFLRNPLLRFSVLVTATAAGMIILLMTLNGGNEQSLDSPWTKVFVAGISVGVGAVYLFWDIKRHPLDGP